MAAIAECIPIAQVLNASGKVPSDITSHEKAGRLVHDWLSQPGNDDWLLIIDNLDNQSSDTVRFVPRIERRCIQSVL